MNRSAIYLFEHDYLQEINLGQLHASILKIRELSWMREVLRGLPEFAELLSRRIPELRSSASLIEIEDISRQFDSDTTSSTLDLPSAALLASTIVLHHLGQYIHYLENVGGGPCLSDYYWDQSTRRVAITGNNIGLLSALAVSVSSNVSELQRYGAVAARIAMLLGLIVDAKSESKVQNDRASLVVLSNDQAQKAALESIVNDFPDAVSTVYEDEHRNRITCPVGELPAVETRLRERGLTVSRAVSPGGYHDPRNIPELELLLSVCAESSDLQLPDASQLRFPTYSTNSIERIREGSLHGIAIRAILLDPDQWDRTLEVVIPSHTYDGKPELIRLGLATHTPSALLRDDDSRRVIRLSDTVDASAASLASSAVSSPLSDCGIAVVGMSIKVAGADDINEFWDLMNHGRPQCRELPEERFRRDAQQSFYANLLRDPGAFDHKFFRKSPREATTQDPQHRLFLQAAYQAVEQSGYLRASHRDTDVGVFVGASSADYATNIASHPANAFSATGNLRSFIAGKVSHYFGWTGPALTIDAACASSSFAIHRACRAIIEGDCKQALAGGVMLMTNPTNFENLRAASLLSPTGPCRPFEAAADGYCRGEAVACVLLKKLSAAIEDGDHIIGNIAATTVSHSERDDGAMSGFVVPNISSLSGAFSAAMRSAGLSPHDVSYVEATGTGLPSGDLAEWHGIEEAIRGADIKEKVPIGSVKSLVGHTECASGVVSLIKVLLMLRHQTIPPQAGFQSLHPELHDNLLEVSRRRRRWDKKRRAALISNYSISGSIAALAITNDEPRKTSNHLLIRECMVEQPICITGVDVRSLRAKATRLIDFLRSNPKIAPVDIAFNLSYQADRSLTQTLAFGASTVSELSRQLQTFVDGDSGQRVFVSGAKRPVILFLGESERQNVGLDSGLYRSIRIIQRYLDRCNHALLSIGAESIYPDIFDGNEIQDKIKLRTCQFSLQYAVAQCWLQSGMEIAAVFGHSFGELACLAISGVLSLDETLRSVVTTAKVDNGWEAVPRSELVTTDEAPRKARLRYELCSSLGFSGPITPRILLPESRLPIHAADSLRRVQREFPSAIWLGTDPNVKMKTLLEEFPEGCIGASHVSCPDICSTSGIHSLTKTLLRLWEEGVPVQHWAHHSSQSMSYELLFLHPYQFEESHHWLEIKRPIRERIVGIESSESKPSGHAWTFVGFRDNGKRQARFQLNVKDKESEDALTGHVMFRTIPTCPNAAIINIVLEACRSLRPNARVEDLRPKMHGMEFNVPICRNSVRGIWLTIEDEDPPFRTSSWQVASRLDDDDGNILHLKGRLTFHPSDDLEYLTEFARFSQTGLYEYGIRSSDVHDRVRGQMLYSVFADIAEYAPPYRRLQSWGKRGNVSLGHMVREQSCASSDDLYSLECLLQVSNFWTNNVDHDTDVYVICEIGSWMRAPHRNPEVDRSGSLHLDILCIHHQVTECSSVADAFVFDVTRRCLLQVVTGIRYRRSSRSALSSSLFEQTTYARHSQTAAVSDFSHPKGEEPIKNGTMPRSDGRTSIGSSPSTPPDIQLTANETNHYVPIFAETDKQNDDRALPSSIVSNVVREVVASSDRYVVEFGCSGYMEAVNPAQTSLSVVLILEAFEQLGSYIRDKRPRDVVDPVPHVHKHARYVKFLYDVLAHEGGLITIGPQDVMTRTMVPVPSSSSQDQFDELTEAYPKHRDASKLLFHCGRRLADVLRGKCDGVELMFGSREGRDLLSALYSDFPLNRLSYQQVGDVLSGLIARLPRDNSGPLKILELGAGTGGMTKHLLPTLATAGIEGQSCSSMFPITPHQTLRSVDPDHAPVEYTFTDLAPSFVTAARRKHVGHDFVRFRTYDMETSPSHDLLESQHIVLASNAVHATRDLGASVARIRKFLRPDGILVMVEMTASLPWVDLVFGLFEGWWLFDDGRTHALADRSRWRDILRNAGFGRVDFTGGLLAENGVQVVYVAMDLEG